MLTYISLVIAGLLALFLGGEWLVRGAVALAARLGLPTLLISLTVVGFGTSMPELLVSVRASIEGQSGIALGNVVGSNTANILFITGVSALFAPMTRWDAGVKRDAFVMIAAAVTALLLVQFDVIGRIAGIAMIALLSAYIAGTYFAGRKTAPENEFAAMPGLSGARTALFLAAGLVLLFGGAETLVRGATGMARSFGISEAVIGLTIVAVGTSLPELATSIVAAFRRHSDIAIGNVVGSNIFNILGILGVTAIIAPVRVATNFPHFDVPVMLGVSILFTTVLIAGKRIGRRLAAVLLGGYATYIALLFGIEV